MGLHQFFGRRLRGEGSRAIGLALGERVFRRGRAQGDAGDRAYGEAEFAAGTEFSEHGVDLFGGSNDGACRAALEAFGAADTIGFFNMGKHRRRRRVGRSLNRQAEGMGDIGCNAGSTGGAEVWSGRFFCQSLGVGRATGIAAACALGAREQGLELGCGRHCVLGDNRLKMYT